MELKKMLKAPLFFGLSVAVLSSASIFSPSVEAATYNYSNRSVTSKGNSDYGVYNGKVVNIKDFYNDYVSPNSVSVSSLNGEYHTKNNNFDNFEYIYDKKCNSYIKIYGDDPICAFVDKSCFRQEGDFFLMGDEYGYYVYTTKFQTYSYQSIVLLFDISYDWEYASNSNSTSQFVKLEIVSQTAVVTVKEDQFSNELSFLDTSKVLYVPKVKSYDGWVTCPGIIEKTDNGKHIATIRQCDELYLTDICYCAEYENDSQSSSDITKFTTVTPISPRYHILELKNEPSTSDKISKYSYVVTHNIGDYGLACIPYFGVAYSALTTLININNECGELNYSYQSQFINEEFNSTTTIARNESSVNYCCNDLTRDSKRYVILGKHEDVADSIGFKTRFTGENKIYTDSILTALPIRKNHKSNGEYAETPVNITYMNNIYGEPAICSRRYMNYSRECPKMRDTKNLGDITRKPSSLNNISIEGTTPYISQFKVTNPGNYTFSVYGSNQEKTRIIIWDTITKKAIYINDYCLKIDSSVYLPSGNYYMEISPKLDNASVNSIAKQIATKTELISYYNSKIDELKREINTLENLCQNCDADKEKLKNLIKSRDQCYQEKINLENSLDFENKKLKLAAASSRTVTFSTSKLSSSKPTCS